MDFKQLYSLLKSHYSAKDLERNTRELFELEKRICHDDFDRSTAYVVQELQKAGFSDVERIEHVADGETAFADSIMPEAWNLDGRAYLEVVSPWREGERIIADTNEVPFAAATWCGATPDEGACGELILFDPQHPEKAQGKWVLINGMPSGSINQPLARAGALGIVSVTWDQGWENPDSTRWLNGQGSWGWYYVKGDLRLPIFSITARRAISLITELKTGRAVVLKGVLKARYGKGKIYTVTARIPGESAEEYGIFAHMYEPFLSDDCSGAASCIQIGRMIKESGIRLKRSLRVVLSFEHYGFAAYFAGCKHNLKAGMNMDMFATTMYRDLGFPLHWRLSTMSLPFFGDLLMQTIIRQTNPELRIDPTYGNLSDDTLAGEPSYNIPTNWLYVENEPSPLHHSSSELFNGVDWELAETVSTLVATLGAFLISADKEDYEAVLPELTDLAVSAVTDHRFDTPFERKVRCDFAAGQLESINNWMPGIMDQQSAGAIIAPYRIDGDELTAATENEKTAARMFVTRQITGTPWSLAAIPYAERNYHGGRINKLFFTLCDGTRSLLEAIRIADVAHYNTTSDEKIGCVIKFMRYLEKYGYVKIALQ